MLLGLGSELVVTIAELMSLSSAFVSERKTVRERHLVAEARDASEGTSHGKVLV